MVWKKLCVVLYDITDDHMHLLQANTTTWTYIWYETETFLLMGYRASGQWQINKKFQSVSFRSYGSETYLNKNKYSCRMNYDYFQFKYNVTGTKALSLLIDRVV